MAVRTAVFDSAIDRRGLPFRLKGCVLKGSSATAGAMQASAPLLNMEVIFQIGSPVRGSRVIFQSPARVRSFL